MVMQMVTDPRHLHKTHLGSIHLKTVVSSVSPIKSRAGLNTKKIKTEMFGQSDDIGECSKAVVSRPSPRLQTADASVTLQQK